MENYKTTKNTPLKQTVVFVNVVENTVKKQTDKKNCK